MTQRHGIYSVPLPISGKKVAANVVTLAAWRSGRDSNPRAIARKLISRCLGNHSDKIRRKFLSNSSSQIHSHTLLPIHLIVSLRMR